MHCPPFHLSSNGRSGGTNPERKSACSSRSSQSHVTCGGVAAAHDASNAVRRRSHFLHHASAPITTMSSAPVPRRCPARARASVQGSNVGMLRKTSEPAIFEADGAVADGIARHETIPRLAIKHCFDARTINLRRRHHVHQTERHMPSIGFRTNRSVRPAASSDLSLWNTHGRNCVARERPCESGLPIKLDCQLDSIRAADEE